MPRVKGATVNKSEEIRKVLSGNPKMKAKAVVEVLKQKGIEVKPNAVYFIKTKEKVRRRKIQKAHAISAGRGAGLSEPVQLVLKAKALAHEAGGIRNLKLLVDALAD